jgi:hypothetical protein
MNESCTCVQEVMAIVMDMLQFHARSETCPILPTRPRHISWRLYLR